MTQEELKKLVKYDRSTGVFNWVNCAGTKKDPNRPLGYKHGFGYLIIDINNKKYMAHRLAWLYENGFMPKDHLDHINGIKTDNRIENLREATNQENQFNSKLRIDNSSGIKGVHWHKDINKWIARIRTGSRKRLYLGSFDSLDLAAAAVNNARLKYHGEFANHG